MKNILMITAGVVALLAAAPAMAEGVTAGAHAGVNDHSQGQAGVSVGYQFNDTYAAEVVYDRAFVPDLKAVGLNRVLQRAEDAVAVNGIVTIPAPVIKDLSLYGVGGVGYRFNTVADRNATWDVGVGARYAVTPRVSLDVRADRTTDFGASRGSNAYTAGLVYRF
jgi:opacity protein-like surface antigen